MSIRLVRIVNDKAPNLPHKIKRNDKVKPPNPFNSRLPIFEEGKRLLALTDGFNANQISCLGSLLPVVI